MLRMPPFPIRMGTPTRGRRTALFGSMLMGSTISSTTATLAPLSKPRNCLSLSLLLFIFFAEWLLRSVLIHDFLWVALVFSFFFCYVREICQIFDWIMLFEEFLNFFLILFLGFIRVLFLLCGKIHCILVIINCISSWSASV